MASVVCEREHAIWGGGWLETQEGPSCVFVYSIIQDYVNFLRPQSCLQYLPAQLSLFVVEIKPILFLDFYREPRSIVVRILKIDLQNVNHSQ